ncbi:MAG: pyridoxamine 5'-phosphate oxidase family protein [Dysgonamonadaceae bacterium]|nr:pyridoxamine 5'-phosphate oxidase family protein [Dysgonamonadaceae bacterium]
MKTYPIQEKEKIEQILKSEQICYVGFADEEGIPYVLPMNYGYENGFIYLHSGPEGKAIQILDINPNVCITFCTQPKLIWQHPDVACSYRMQSESVVCNGKVIFEENFEEKVKILNIIMRQYSDKDFKYSVPAINNVKIWKVDIDTISAKEYGVRHPNSAMYKDRESF